MKQFLSFVCILAFSIQCSLGQLAAPARDSFQNPFSISLADPYVLYEDGAGYYMYGTGGRAEKGFSAYFSSDLVNWKYQGQVYFGNNQNGWGTGDYWAPEVYKVNGKYYMFYSAQWKENPTNELENFRIGVASSDKPTGPFIDVAKRPVYDPGYPIIDANVLFDDNGKVYLYYSRCCYKHAVKSEVADWAKQQGWFNEVEESWVYGIELKPDLTGTIGEAKIVTAPSIVFEGCSIRMGKQVRDFQRSEPSMDGRFVCF